MVSKIWWLVHKDLVVEYRSRQAWPAMVVLGVVVVMVFSLQIDLPFPQRAAVAPTLLWLAILFSGLAAIERSSAAEQHNGCWKGLALYPLPASIIYGSKVVSNLLALCLLECVLFPLFAVLVDVPFLQHIWATALVAFLASTGIAAVGTLVSALSCGLRQQGVVISLLVLPIVIPIVLAAAEATRLSSEHELGHIWWRWIQFLGGFALVFLTLGIVLFGFVIEE